MTVSTIEGRYTEAITQMLTTREMSRINEIATCASSVSTSEVVAWTSSGDHIDSPVYRATQCCTAVDV